MGVIDLWMSPESGASAGQVEETPGRASLEKLGCRTPPQLHAGGVGRQQQHEKTGRGEHKTTLRQEGGDT